MPDRHIWIFACFAVLACACNTPTGGEQGTSPIRDTAAQLRTILQQYPDSLSARIALSRWLEKTGGIDSALSPIEAGLRSDSTIPALHNRKALLLLQKTDTAGAIQSLIRSLQCAPEQTDVHLELGFLYAAQKNKAALEVSDFLLSQSQEPLLNSQARYMKGLYYTNTGMRKEALAMFDEIIVNDYTFIDAYIEKGILQYNNKQFAEALKTFDRAVTVSNTHAESYLWMAKCLEALGRNAEALDLFKKTAGFNAGLPEAEEGVRRLEDGK
jgi:tetratricopeptide (TPR) repeat protein